jgi:hypothetical protein
MPTLFHLKPHSDTERLPGLDGEDFWNELSPNRLRLILESREGQEGK